MVIIIDMDGEETTIISQSETSDDHIQIYPEDFPEPRLQSIFEENDDSRSFNRFPA